MVAKDERPRERHDCEDNDGSDESDESGRDEKEDCLRAVVTGRRSTEKVRLKSGSIEGACDGKGVEGVFEMGSPGWHSIEAWEQDHDAERGPEEKEERVDKNGNGDDGENGEETECGHASGKVGVRLFQGKWREGVGIEIGAENEQDSEGVVESCLLARDFA